MLGIHASAVRLVSPGFVIGSGVVALVLVVLVVARWRRWRRPRIGRTVTVVAAVLAVVLAGATAVNKLGTFYPTLGALAGTSTAPVPAPAGPAVAVADGPGSLHTVPGPDGDVTVYLPAALTGPALAGVRFPVVMWLGPLTGAPIVAALDRAIATGRIAPVVLIATTGDDPAALRAWAPTVLPVRTDRAGWGVAGPADGDGCPLDVALRHPGSYAAAAGPACAPDPVTGPPAPLALLGTAVAGQGGGRAALDRLAAMALPATQLTRYVLPHAAGGDDDLLGWLGGQLPGPVRETVGDDDVPS